VSGGTIFAGGNDGMLHAFDAQNGWERFAYVPNLVMENLKHLKDVNPTTILMLSCLSL
jgi:type IV pilus assembly protein PilY1